jgi:chemotaxis protein MotB
MSTPRKRRSGHEEEHENHERWMISYADMLTLLMVLFIVLFAISQVDQKKFNALRSGIAAGFGAPTGADGIAGPDSQDPGVSDGAVTAGSKSISTNDVLVDPDMNRNLQNNNSDVAADRKRQQQLTAAAQAELDKLGELQKSISGALEKAGLKGKIQFKVTERGLVLAIVTDRVIFTGDSAELRPEGAKVLAAVGPALRAVPNQIVVEGHTNQLGVSNPLYPSLWELSVARASSVVRYLISSQRVNAKRLEAAGFGKERPLYPPSDRRAITQNRRVEIIVLSDLPSESRTLLPTLAAANAASAVTAANEAQGK